MNINYVNFTTLNEAQKAMILEWRNHPNVRTYMYNTGVISQKTHLEFIESLKTKENKRYFLVQRENENIGVIDFTDITPTSATMGIYANPYLTQKGIGSILLQAIVDYAFDVLKVQTLKAEVFATNTKAKTLYKKFGFRAMNQGSVNEKEVICMELENANRSL